MADIDPGDPEFNEKLKLKIRQRFINQVGPFKVVDLIHRVDKNVLTDKDIEHIKICTKDDGNFVGAEELFNRLTQYKGWFATLMVALRQALPEVATKLAGDYDEVMIKLSAARSHEVHLKDGKGCTLLLDAATRGHIGCIQSLLSCSDVDLNSKNERGETAVYLAAERGHIDCLEILIQAGCDAKLRNNDRNSPLYVATRNGYCPCVEVLIKAHAIQVTAYDNNYKSFSLEPVNKYGFSPVLAAAAKGHVECLKLLLDAGATAENCATERLEVFTPLMAAALAGEEKCVQVLIKAFANTHEKDKYGRTPLHIAAMEGRVKCLQVLIEAGANINTQENCGYSPLCSACVFRHYECVRLLLSAGADVYATTESGRTALMVAAFSGDDESLQALIEAKSNLNKQESEGKTALMIAAEKMQNKCVQILVKHGADIHLRDQLGRSAIHYAASEYSFQLILLLDLGSDINAVDNNGETPLMLATRQNMDEAVQFLLMKGADVQKVNNEGQTAFTIAESIEDGWVCADLLQRKTRTDVIREEADNEKTKDNNSVNGSNHNKDDAQCSSDIEQIDTLRSGPVEVEYCIVPENRSTHDGSYEVERSTEFEGFLQQLNTDCQKNPGHVGFIPVTEFGLSHLPDKYRDQRIVDVIKAEAELTVRLLVKYTSPARPDGYNAFKMRGTKGRRVGSGRITNVVIKHTPEDNKKCPCPECENSADPKMEWTGVEIKTATHVVYDSSEAKQTLVHIFADVDKPQEMHKLYGYNVGIHNQGDDNCNIHAATHDLRLCKYLKSMIEQRRNLRKLCKYVDNNFVAIVSHPHGCSKQITMGEWTKRFSAERMDLKSNYIYNVPTCPGSSGAPVIVFQRNQSDTIHPHSGVRQGQNLSGSSVVDRGLSPFEISPTNGGYSKKGKRQNGTGKLLPKGWETLIEPEQERPTQGRSVALCRG